MWRHRNNEVIILEGTDMKENLKTGVLFHGINNHTTIVADDGKIVIDSGLDMSYPWNISWSSRALATHAV